MLELKAGYCHSVCYR